MSANAIAATLARLQPVLRAIQAAGGTPLLVGGAVRDLHLGHLPKDIDIEVYGLAADRISDALAPLGRVNAVGRSFGVLKLHQPGADPIDVSLPRRESKVGVGHRGFLVDPDPSMTPCEAAARRDFTWNAMALTPSGELLDFYGGAADLRARVIRHVTLAFAEDPLRVLRAVQFAARFGMQMAPETAALCRSLRDEAATLAVERIWGEWHKWALQGCWPGAGLRVLEASGWLELLPELAALVGCPQNQRYHPEGDVWTHTGHVCDIAAQVAEREQLDAEARTVLLFAALCHDLGKPLTTCCDSNGLARSPRHAGAGVAPAQSFLERIGAPKWLVAQVSPLVSEHMAHLRLPVEPTAVRRLAVRLAPATLRRWAQLLESDCSGRPPLPPGQPGLGYLALAEQLAAADGPPAPLLAGRDLQQLGVPPGPAMGQLLRRAYQAQLDGAFTTLAEGLAWVAENREAPPEARG